MKNQFKPLIIAFTFIVFSCNLSLSQTTGKTTVFSGKAKFLMTEINFENFKAYQNCVGLVMFENVSGRTLRIAAITKEFGYILVNMKSQKIRPKQKGILTYTLINPSPGEHHSNSLIFFKEFNDPVKIAIKGNFL